MRKVVAAIALLLCSSMITAQQSMNNEAVIKLVKAGLSDDIIVTTINASPGTYNTSTDGLIALKAGGASDKVISAILLKNAGAAPVAASVPASQSGAPLLIPMGPNGLPQGIDDIGVYYRDKSGAWTHLPPEIVNFKSGGALKSIATIGIVKGDLNGHMEGEHSKTILMFPVVLAVYIPEGTDIAEYQLLRFRVSGGAREFRSVTGGVMHSSGGAIRDSVEFQSDKIAPHVYQITLQTALGRGEYGILPPYGGSNMGSSGKIYSISIPQ